MSQISIYLEELKSQIDDVVKDERDKFCYIYGFQVIASHPTLEDAIMNSFDRILTVLYVPKGTEISKFTMPDSVIAVIS